MDLQSIRTVEGFNTYRQAPNCNSELLKILMILNLVIVISLLLRKIKKSVEVKLYSLEQYIGLIEDKLSSTTVDFFRSEGYLETKCLYWNREPKKC